LGASSSSASLVVFLMILVLLGLLNLLDLTVTSNNAPVLLTSYDVYLYQNGVLVRNVSDVRFAVIGVLPFVYTFQDVTINAAFTQFYAVIVKNFIIIPLVWIESNHINVTAKIKTNSTLDRSMGTNIGSGLVGSAFMPFLSTKLIVTPPVANGPTIITSETQQCETYIDNVLRKNVSSGFLLRDDPPSPDFNRNCVLASLADEADFGKQVVVHLYYSGDATYAYSSANISFVIRPDFDYTAADVTVTYPSDEGGSNNLVTRSHVASPSRRKVKKVKKTKKNKNHKKNNERRRRRRSAQ